MSLLKKLTKPISKILDKIIPNEIKPALPYLSAFAPFMLGPGSNLVGASTWQKLLYNPATRAGIMGGLNIGSQVAQEGSEGEFGGLSALMAAGTGALTAGGAPGMFRGMQRDVPYKDIMTDTVISPTQDTGIMASIKDAIGKGGETASKFLIEQGDILRPGGEELTMKNALTAGAVPITQGTGDLAMISARQALDEFNAGLEEGSDAWYDDDARRIAIRRAMEMAGHVEDDIVSALAALGLKEGGRVNKKGGGILEIEFKEMANGGMTDTVLPRGTEMDYRGGGMIPMGSKERADDVPARLSKNEFVMTADAVRAAGGGSVNVGAKRMYDLMHNLEARV